MLAHRGEGGGQGNRGPMLSAGHPASVVCVRGGSGPKLVPILSDNQCPCLPACLPAGLDFVFHMFFLVKYCKSLEEGEWGNLWQQYGCALRRGCHVAYGDHARGAPGQT